MEDIFYGYNVISYRLYKITIIKRYSENYIRTGTEYSVYKGVDSTNILIFIGGRNFKIFR